MKRIGNLELRPRYKVTLKGFISTYGENGFEILKWQESKYSPECWHGGYYKDDVWLPAIQEKNMSEDERPKEYCYVIAFINWDDKNDDIEIDCVGSRILLECEEQWLDIKSLLKEAQNELLRING